MSNNPFDTNGINFPNLEEYINQVLDQSLNQSMNQSNDGFNSFDKSNLKHYIQKILSQSLGYNDNNLYTMKNSKTYQHPEPQFFEIHGFTIVRLQIPSQINHKNIKVFSQGNKVLINWGPELEEQILQLMTNVAPGNAKAIAKDNVLELRIPLDVESEKKEINIQFL